MVPHLGDISGIEQCSQQLEVIQQVMCTVQGLQDLGTQGELQGLSQTCISPNICLRAANRHS